MDRQRYSSIAHGDMLVWNPLQCLQFEDLAPLLTVPNDGCILDIGCGRGYWLVKSAELFDLKTAIGVDASRYAANAAQQEAANSSARCHIEIVHGEFDPAAYGDESFDFIFCIGASHALTNYQVALSEAYRLLRLNAQLLIGEGYWKCKPDPEYLAFLDCIENSYTTHEGNCRRAIAQGFDLKWNYQCTDLEWSTYEDQYANNVENYVHANPTDPDALEMLSTIRRWREHYLRFGRDTLGFGLYLFSKTSHS